MQKILSFFSSLLILGMLFSSAVLASTTECSTATAQYHLKQFHSDGGAYPTPEMIRPHWFVNGSEDLSVVASVNEASRIIVSQAICPSWPKPSTNDCRFSEIDSTVQVHLAGGIAESSWSADVLMLCHDHKYVGPPIP